MEGKKSLALIVLSLMMLVIVTDATGNFQSPCQKECEKKCSSVDKKSPLFKQCVDRCLNRCNSFVGDCSRLCQDKCIAAGYQPGTIEFNKCVNKCVKICDRA